jgi:hypothetical protein
MKFAYIYSIIFEIVPDKKYKPIKLGISRYNNSGTISKIIE